MKTFLLTAIGALAIFSTITLTSCKEDKCKGTVCAYDGVCNETDGSCTCQTGYEGTRCETITRDKFEGTWRVVETGTSSGPTEYATSIEAGNSINQVIIYNFYNLFNPTITATVQGDTLYIPTQQVVSGDSTYTVQGQGYAVPAAYYDLHGQLILSYSVTSATGAVDNFGENGGSNTSIWTK